MLTIKPPKPNANGDMVAVELDLQTFAPVVITGADFSAPARLIVCNDKNVQQKLLTKKYQFSEDVPPGVLFELASNVIWNKFNFNKPPVNFEQYEIWLIYPYEWQPVTVKSKTGKLYCIIETRTGDAKHKAQPVITLHTQ